MMLFQVKKEHVKIFVSRQKFLNYVISSAKGSWNTVL